MLGQQLQCLLTALDAFAYIPKPKRKFTSKPKTKITPNPKVKRNLSLNLLRLNPLQLT